MIHLTESLKQWLFTNYPELLPLIKFGHVELFTPEMNKKYTAWCQTDEGKQYLVGGSKYRDPS